MGETTMRLRSVTCSACEPEWREVASRLLRSERVPGLKPARTGLPNVGFAVTRAHHADVGGREPGSMPADSHTLAEEGVVIPPTLLDDESVAQLVAQMRNPDERRGDLRAQLAAHRLAEQRIFAVNAMVRTWPQWPNK